MKIGIAIPTYNEATNIELLISSIFKELSVDKDSQIILLIIDDNSPDGTGKIVNNVSDKLSSSNFKIKLLSREIKDGLGRAYIAGFKELLDLGVDHILQMDADLSHNPVYIPAFIKAAKHSDLVVGSRYIDGGDTPDWALTRRILSRGGNSYARMILGNKVSDYTGGFNMYSTDLIKKINPSSITNSGYGFLIELKYRAILNAKNIFEIPIVFNDRQHGKSKIPKSTLFKNLILVPMLRMGKSKY